MATSIQFMRGLKAKVDAANIKDGQPALVRRSGASPLLYVGTGAGAGTAKQLAPDVDVYGNLGVTANQAFSIRRNTSNTNNWSQIYFDKLDDAQYAGVLYPYHTANVDLGKQSNRFRTAYIRTTETKQLDAEDGTSIIGRSDTPFSAGYISVLNSVSRAVPVANDTGTIGTADTRFASGYFYRVNAQTEITTTGGVYAPLFQRNVTAANQNMTVGPYTSDSTTTTEFRSGINFRTIKHKANKTNVSRWMYYSMYADNADDAAAFYPDASNTTDIGTTSNRFRTFYIGTVNLNGQIIKPSPGSGNSSTINCMTLESQPHSWQSTATGTMQTQFQFRVHNSVQSTAGGTPVDTTMTLYLDPGSWNGIELRPHATNTGSIGSDSIRWAIGNFQNLSITGSLLPKTANVSSVGSETAYMKEGNFNTLYNRTSTGRKRVPVIQSNTAAPASGFSGTPQNGDIYIQFSAT